MQSTSYEMPGWMNHKLESRLIRITSTTSYKQNISWEIDGETVETATDFILGAPKSLKMVTAAMKLKDICSLEEKR